MKSASGVRKIAIVTSTRADWGLLSPVARHLQAYPGVELQIIATNMHLDASRGMTAGEIASDGFQISRRVEMPSASSLPADVCHAAALCLDGMGEAFSELQPDLLLMLGDRFEMLAVALAATISRIPIAHISGGETTLGAIDDNIRHALTKLSSLHFPTTETHRQRIIAMGEQPDRVINAGALGVDSFSKMTPLPKAEIERFINMTIDQSTLLVTYHPATADSLPPSQGLRSLLNALASLNDVKIIITYPNNDPGSDGLIDMINAFAAERPGSVAAVPSLGHKRYLSALHYVDAVIGNSSSGIVEVPSAGIPTVDIGMRQHGRTASESVIHCDNSTAAITASINKALSPEWRRKCAAAPNPYHKPGTAAIIADALVKCDISTLLPKHFYDIGQ